MDFNMKGATRGLLTGIKVNYRDEKKQQMEFARQEHLATTQMNKEKELYSFEVAAKKKAADAQYPIDQERARKERETIRGEGETQKDTDFDRKKREAEEGATAQGKATVAKASAEVSAQFPELDPKSPEFMAKVEEKMSPSTAGQLKDKLVKSIIDGAKKDANGQPVFSLMEKARLAAQGVKVPGALPPLTDAVSAGLLKDVKREIAAELDPDKTTLNWKSMLDEVNLGRVQGGQQKLTMSKFQAMWKDREVTTRWEKAKARLRPPRPQAPGPQGAQAPPPPQAPAGALQGGPGAGQVRPSGNPRQSGGPGAGQEGAMAGPKEDDLGGLFSRL